MMGTLAGVLAKKKIRTFQDRFKALVTGDVENIEGTLKITRIHVDYRLKVADDRRRDAMEALENYIHLCPAAQSVVGCIDLKHEMSFVAEDN